MDPQFAFRMVCRAAFILRSGSGGLVTPLDWPILMEYVTINHLFYRPRFIDPVLFRASVAHHFSLFQVPPSFVDDNLIKWMVMVFESMLAGELQLPEGTF